jgi:hypothetical protein
MAESFVSSRLQDVGISPDTSIAQLRDTTSRHIHETHLRAARVAQRADRRALPYSFAEPMRATFNTRDGDVAAVHA